MNRVIPRLEVRYDEELSESYKVVNDSAFTADAWPDSLADIERAGTIGGQQIALAIGIIGVVGTRPNCGLMRMDDGKASASLLHTVDARFRLDDGNPTLSFIRAKGTQTEIGYLSPKEGIKNQAYAVVNRPKNYHRVVRDPSEALDPVEISLGLDVVSTLARALEIRENQHK